MNRSLLSFRQRARSRITPGPRSLPVTSPSYRASCGPPRRLLWASNYADRGCYRPLTRWMTARFIHKRGQILPCCENGVHYVVAVFPEVVILPEPAFRGIQVPIGRPPMVGFGKGGRRFLCDERPVAFYLCPDSAMQPSTRREERLVIPFQSHIRILILFRPTLSTQAQTWPLSSDSKRTYALFSEPFPS